MHVSRGGPAAHRHRISASFGELLHSDGGACARKKFRRLPSQSFAKRSCRCCAVPTFTGASRRYRGATFQRCVDWCEKFRQRGGAFVDRVHDGRELDAGRQRGVVRPTGLGADRRHRATQQGSNVLAAMQAPGVPTNLRFRRRDLVLRQPRVVDGRVSGPIKQWRAARVRASRAQGARHVRVLDA